MKFGFDIDDTLIDLRRHAFHIYNKKLIATFIIVAFFVMYNIIIISQITTIYYNYKFETLNLC